MDTEARDQLCCDIINQYLFDNVWNEPVSEYRVNVHPQLIKIAPLREVSRQIVRLYIYLLIMNHTSYGT